MCRFSLLRTSGPSLLCRRQIAFDLIGRDCFDGHELSNDFIYHSISCRFEMIEIDLCSGCASTFGPTISFLWFFLVCCQRRLNTKWLNCYCWLLTMETETCLLNVLNYLDPDSAIIAIKTLSSAQQIRAIALQRAQSDCEIDSTATHLFRQKLICLLIAIHWQRLRSYENERNQYHTVFINKMPMNFENLNGHIWTATNRFPLRSFSNAQRIAESTAKCGMISVFREISAKITVQNWDLWDPHRRPSPYNASINGNNERWA